MASSVSSDVFLLQSMCMLLIECSIINFSYFISAGEGQYGKVYTCISVDTGELMAMKEVSTLYTRISAVLVVFSKLNVHDLADEKDFLTLLLANWERMVRQIVSSGSHICYYHLFLLKFHNLFIFSLQLSI